MVDLPNRSHHSELTVLAVVPARRDSRGLPAKNTRSLLGRPVVSYTLDAACRADTITHILVTSNDPVVNDIARQYANGNESPGRCHLPVSETGSARPIMTVDRPETLATDRARIDDALRHGCDHMHRVHHLSPDIVVLLYANIPVREPTIIDRAVRLLIESRADSIQSFTPVGKYHPHWLYRVEQGHAHPCLTDRPATCHRQELPPLYAVDGAVGVVWRSVLEAARQEPDPHAFWGRDRRGIIQDPDDTVDIDTLRDFYLAESLLRLRMEAADHVLAWQ